MENFLSNIVLLEFWLIKEKILIIFCILDQALLSSMIEKVKGYDSILKYIRKSGKEDLYADLISSLSFGSKGYVRYYFCFSLLFFDGWAHNKIILFSCLHDSFHYITILIPASLIQSSFWWSSIPVFYEVLKLFYWLWVCRWSKSKVLILHPRSWLYACSDQETKERLAENEVIIK